MEEKEITVEAKKYTKDGETKRVISAGELAKNLNETNDDVDIDIELTEPNMEIIKRVKDNWILTHKITIIIKIDRDCPNQIWITLQEKGESTVTDELVPGWDTGEVLTSKPGHLYCKLNGYQIKIHWNRDLWKDNLIQGNFPDNYSPNNNKIIQFPKQDDER